MLDNSSHIIPTPEHFEQQFGANGTNSSCQPFTATALLPSILVVIQCALLHPTFAHSQLLRLVRKSLTPINFYWSIRLPFQYCIRPLETSAQFNMIVACMCIYVATKSLEWGFATSSYYKRPLITVNGVSRLEKVKDTDQSYKKLQEDEPCNVFRLMTWTLLQFTSMRGYQFTWGPATILESQKTFELLRRVFLVNIPLTCALALIVITRDSPDRTLRSGLVGMGLVDFPGLGYLTELLYTAAFGVYLSCMVDVRFTALTLVMTYLHKMALYLHLPEPILELCDPIYYQPLYNSPHKADSLAEFWGKRWHSLLKRTFIIGGMKPMVWITQKMGTSSTVQKSAGLLGTFAASAFIHEYLAWVMAQPPHPNPHTITSFPGSGLFFMIHSFAMLIEPKIIPFIPKRLGGARLWLWTFFTLSTITFREQYMARGRIDVALRPLSKWSLAYVLSPMKDS